MDRHPFFARLKRNADKNSGVAVVIAHFVYDVDGAIAQFAARPVEQTHAALARNQSVFNVMAAGPNMLPAREIFPIEQLLGVACLRLKNERSKQQKQTETKIQPHHCFSSGDILALNWDAREIISPIQESSGNSLRWSGCGTGNFCDHGRCGQSSDLYF